jgi:hypothetical protein
MTYAMANYKLNLLTVRQEKQGLMAVAETTSGCSLGGNEFKGLARGLPTTSTC